MGGIDYLTKTEIKRLKDDEEAVRLGLQSSQISIANALKNGIGEAMVNELNEMKNAPAKKEKKFRKWINKWRKKKTS
jgi:hypothetical protein